jgi:gas vesicle protein
LSLSFTFAVELATIYPDETDHAGWRFSMTKSSGIIPVLAAAMFFSAAPVLGDEYTGTNSEQQSQMMQERQKDECLLVAMNCPSNRADTVQQRVDRLKNEISKGSDVYSDQELKALEEQLRWIYSDSDNIYISD